MKRLVLYALILALVWLIPVESTDVAKLQPVEVIAIYQTADTVYLSTDTEDFGVGKDALSALNHMKQTSTGVIYLDTAEYLLIGEGAHSAAEQLRQELKPSVMLCKVVGKVDLVQAAKYLDVHGKLPRLRSWNEENSLPILTIQNGRMAFEKYK